jgi:CRP-like cAMP-binding protein
LTSGPQPKIAEVRAGERTSPGGKAIRNKLLLRLADQEFQIVRPHLEFVDLPHGLNLYQPHRTLRYLHFPDEGLISLVIELKDGKSVEAGVLGKEGAAGVPAILGLERSALREVVQIAGEGCRV